MITMFSLVTNFYSLSVVLLKVNLTKNEMFGVTPSATISLRNLRLVLTSWERWFTIIIKCSPFLQSSSSWTLSPSPLFLSAWAPKNSCSYSSNLILSITSIRSFEYAIEFSLSANFHRWGIKSPFILEQQEESLFSNPIIFIFEVYRSRSWIDESQSGYWSFTFSAA